MISSGDKGINIDVNGNISYNNITANNSDINITANNGNINIDGITYAADKNSNINLTTKSIITNNSQILAENNLSITAGKIINNDVMLANNIINIYSNDLDNNNKITAIDNINLNITNLNNDNATIDSSNIITVRNLTNNNSEIAEFLGINNNISAISNKTGKFTAINAIDIDIKDSDYNINGTLKTDGYINIIANNINSEANIEAIGDIYIKAEDSFTNGITGDNSSINDDILIASASNLEIEAKNDINNYATISAYNNLILTSIDGNISNNIGAELIAKNNDNSIDSIMTLNAFKGSINQYSLNSVVIDGNHSINAYNYTNTGRIDISGDLTMNIENDLINDVGALIYSGNNMTLNIVNNLTNNEYATIYAENDLIIQKYDSSHVNYDISDNGINKLENISENYFIFWKCKY